MKIERMNKGQWGKVRAFFDLTTEEGFTIKGFKIIEGINGLFVGMPSQKGNDGEYYDSVFTAKETRDRLNQFVLDEYRGSGATSTENVSPPLDNSISESPPESSPVTVDSDEPTEQTNKPYEDSDIPF